MPKRVPSYAARPGVKNASGNVEIRLMELADLPPVFELGTRLFTAEDWPTLYRAWDDHDLTQLFASSAETCLVAEKADSRRIIGFALGSMMEKPRSAWRYGWVEWLAVAPRYQRKGIAARLMRQMTHRFIARGARMVLVDTDEANTKALALFRKLGFANELRHVYLSWNLDDHPDVIQKREAGEEE